jgi:hypothetical protein
MARKESTELATEWFSKYLKVIISDQEARESVAEQMALRFERESYET